MGVGKREDILYLRVSKGVLKNKIKSIEASTYTGIIIGIREKNGTYDGQPTCDIEVKMRDSDPGSTEIAIIQFRKEGWFSLGFFSRIRKVELDKPVTIGVTGIKDNEKVSFCWLSQKGNPLSNEKGTLDKDKSFPQFTKVKVSGKEVNDWTAPFAEMDSIVKFISEKLSAINPAASTPVSAEVEDENEPPF